MTTKKIIITPEYLKDMFMTSDTSLISLSSKSKKSSKSYIEEHGELDRSKYTPFSKQLLESLTPYSRKRMADELHEDDREISRIEIKTAEDDPDYSYFENQEIGVILEKWICVNLKCNCGSKYVKYINPNMPIIDIRCSNEKHDITLYGPKYYQIKSTQNNKLNHYGYKYFDIKEHYIHVGSRKYGEICHSIITSDIEKDLLIGYMCITYKKINNDNIKIIKHLSFILSPKTDSSILAKSERYYTYIEPYPKAIMISFNPDLFDINFIESHIINIHQQYDEQLFVKAIPISYEQKYLKYKQKYLELKRNIFIE
jgi:hypothetical protein